MNIQDVPADRSALVAWTAYQARKRRVLIRRTIKWPCRKLRPDLTALLEQQIDANLRHRAQAYMRGES